jgi:hypothetical protein
MKNPVAAFQSVGLFLLVWRMQDSPECDHG